MSTEDIDLSAVRIGKGNCAIHYWVSNSIALKTHGVKEGPQTTLIKHKLHLIKQIKPN